MKGGEIVADVYCGTGTITLFLAQKAKQVYGIEIVDSAIRDAVRNAKDNKIGNAQFILGDAIYKLPELIRNGVRPDVIVLDPPRAGCGEPVLKAIANSNQTRRLRLVQPGNLGPRPGLPKRPRYHTKKGTTRRYVPQDPSRRSRGPYYKGKVRNE